MRDGCVQAFLCVFPRSNQTEMGPIHSSDDGVDFVGQPIAAENRTQRWTFDSQTRERDTLPPPLDRFP